MHYVMQSIHPSRTVFVHLEDELLAAGRAPLLVPLQLGELDLLAQEKVVGDHLLGQSLVLIVEFDLGCPKIFGPNWKKNIQFNG